MTLRKEKEGGMYEVFNMKIVLTKQIHVSCVEDTLKSIKSLGDIESIDMSYEVDNSPRFGQEIVKD